MGTSKLSETGANSYVALPQHQLVPAKPPRFGNKSRLWNSLLVGFLVLEAGRLYSGPALLTAKILHI